MLEPEQTEDLVSAAPPLPEERLLVPAASGPAWGRRRGALSELLAAGTSDAMRAMRVAEAGAPRVGSVVLLEGTGRWWAGATHSAVVVDVRAGDATVKVRYGDGGYKRFPRAEFLALVRPEAEACSAASDFGREPYEWAEDMICRYRSSDDVGFEQRAARLRDEQARAALADDRAAAEDARRRLSDLRREREELRLLRAQLAEAVRATDFLRAHAIQQRIDALAAPPASLRDAIGSAAHRAVGGGFAGAAAMVVQVVTLMWLRTTLYYQYRHGTPALETLRVLYRQGGVRRFYRGVAPALAQGPLCRFGDTAANAGVLVLFDAVGPAGLPVALKGLVSAALASAWRMLLMPLDTVKSFLQVEGSEGVRMLRAKRRAHGAAVLWHGAVGTCAATFVGHYVWFSTFNYLDARLPTPGGLPRRLARNAGVGFCASAASDTVTNSVRVLKTYRQTSEQQVSYTDAARGIVERDGLAGLCGRGLTTRIAANGVQAALFSALWKFFEQKLAVGAA